MKTKYMVGPPVALFIALLLSGCWGGGDDNRSSGTGTSGAVPDSAGVSAKSFIDFILSLNPNDETSDPLVLKDFSVPADETNDPQMLS